MYSALISRGFFTKQTKPIKNWSDLSIARVIILGTAKFDSSLNNKKLLRLD